uniref:Uncharacterized protein n=1 Tax=Oryza glaberrima TaxID=4538 RepID=I1PLR7_ORYGL
MAWSSRRWKNSSDDRLPHKAPTGRQDSRDSGPKWSCHTHRVLSFSSASAESLTLSVDLYAPRINLIF